MIVRVWKAFASSPPLIGAIALSPSPCLKWSTVCFEVLWAEADIADGRAAQLAADISSVKSSAVDERANMAAGEAAAAAETDGGKGVAEAATECSEDFDEYRQYRHKPLDAFLCHIRKLVQLSGTKRL